MPDRSLIFFYSLMLFAFIFIIIKIKRDNQRFSIMIYLSSLLASMVLASFIYNFGTAYWFLSAFALSYLISLVIISIFIAVKYHLRKRRFNDKVNTVKNEGAECLESLYLNEPDDRWHSLHWHVVYFPQQNMLEIAVNLYHDELKPNKKFFSWTLTGRTLRVIPEALIETFTLEQNVICPLSMFMQHSEEARKLVTNYAEAIKQGLPEPWKLHEQQD